MSDYSSLLPSNASFELKALADIAAKHILKDVVTDQLWDPMRCPAAFLPWLAWSYGVKVWESDWPEHVKRQEIAQSVRVHQEGGTKAAIERALTPLDLEIAVDDAPSNQNAPHHVRLSVFADDVFAQGLHVDSDLYRIIERKLHHTKPARSYYDVQVSELFRARVRIGAAVVQRQKRAEQHQVTPRGERVAQGLQVHTQLTQRIIDRTTHHITRRAA